MRISLQLPQLWKKTHPWLIQSRHDYGSWLKARRITVRFELPHSSQQGFTQLPFDYLNFGVNNYSVPQANKQTIKSRGQQSGTGRYYSLQPRPRARGRDTCRWKKSDLSAVGPKSICAHNLNSYPTCTMSYTESDSPSPSRGIWFPCFQVETPTCKKTALSSKPEEVCWSAASLP